MALYHTYRPQTFSEILGQEHVTTTLRNQVLSDTVAHAYLFNGPRGVGKTSTARILAKAVNCGVNKKGEVEKNECSEAITNGSTIDVIEIDAASHTGVDNVREQIIENAQFRPTTLKKKVFIIDEVHMLSTSAFNALLKILEEPPEYVIFILATTEPHKLPATIISRCQRFDFTPIPYEALQQHLATVAKDANITIDDDVLSRIVNKSDGCARDALSLLDQVLSIGIKKITAADISMILPTSDTETIGALTQAFGNKDATKAMEILEHTRSAGVQMKQFGTDFIEYLRYIMMHLAGVDITKIASDYSERTLTELTETAATFSTTSIVMLIDMALTRTNEILRSPIPSLPLEMLVLSWCGDTHPPSQTLSPPPTAEKKATTAQQGVQMPTPAPQTPASNIETTTPSGSWQQVVTALEATNPSLVFILKMASVQESTDTIVLTVGFGFHKDKLLSAETKQTIESTIANIYGTPRTIEVVVSTNTEEATSDNSLHDLAAAFGGQIIA